MSRFGPNLWQRLHDPGSATLLAGLRIVVAGYLLFLYSSPMWSMLHELDLPRPHSLTWSLFPPGIEHALAHPLYPTLYAAAVGSAVAMLLGVATRPATALTAITYVLISEVYYRHTKSHVEWIYWNFILLVMALAPVGDRLSIDALVRRVRGRPRPIAAHGYRWPVEMCILWIGLVYVAASIAKLMPLAAGLTWLQGGMLHHVSTRLYFDGPVHWLLGAPLFDFSLRWPFAVGSVLAVAVEASAILFWLQRRLNPWVMAGIFGMHLGIYVLTGVIAFLYSGVVCAAFFVPPEWFSDFDERAT